MISFISGTYLKKEPTMALKITAHNFRKHFIPVKCKTYRLANVILF